MLKRTAVILCLLVLALAGNKEDWKKRSIYQLLTDRFARNDGQTQGCGDLGNFYITQATIVEEDIEESSTIWTIFKEWALMPYGSLRLSIIVTEDTTAIGVEISTNSTRTSAAKRISSTLSVPVTKEASMSWSTSSEIIWGISIQTLVSTLLSLMPATTMTGVRSLTKILPPTTKIESKTADWQNSLI